MKYILVRMKCCNSAVPSSPPQSVMIRNTDPASLTVSWQPPLEISHNIPITGYVIQYKKNGSRDTVSNTENVNVASGTIHTISELIAITEYSVKVAAMNINGTGPFSESVVGISGKDSELNLHIILCILCSVHKMITCVLFD